jgi:hypothetical protein
MWDSQKIRGGGIIRVRRQIEQSMNRKGGDQRWQREASYAAKGGSGDGVKNPF